MNSLHRRLTGSLIMLLLLVVLATACSGAPAETDADAASQTGTAAGAGMAAALPSATVPSLFTPTALPPAVVSTEPAPLDMPSFALATATATAPPKSDADSQAKAAATEPAVAADPTGPTATPQPTFTPPALPGTSGNDHYWLRRPVPEGGTVWTDKAYPYGSTRNRTLRPHHGVEFYVPTGTPVLATASGTVVVAGSDSESIYGPHADFYGNLVVIQLDSALEGERVYTLYGHLSDIFVSEGQRVDAEQVIAYSGATGVADGAHLHFEVRVGANTYASTRNPLLWLYPFPEHGTVAGRVTWPTGEAVSEVAVFLRRIDAPSRYAATTTYARGEVNPDDNWQENFALDDVVAGYYEVEVRNGSKKYRTEVWVYPYQTSFVEIVLE